jgi:hypothetical protein
LLQIPIAQLARRGDVPGIGLDLLTLWLLPLRFLGDRRREAHATKPGDVRLLRLQFRVAGLFRASIFQFRILARQEMWHLIRPVHARRKSNCVPLSPSLPPFLRRRQLIDELPQSRTKVTLITAARIPKSVAGIDRNFESASIGPAEENLHGRIRKALNAGSGFGPEIWKEVS